MKTLLALKIFGTLCIVLLFFASLFIAAWVIVEIGKRNAERTRQYDDLYAKIKAALEWTPAEGSYYSIFKMFSDLQKLEYKNPEMTGVLKNEYYIKYKKISDEILSENEFSCRSVFGK